MEINSRCTLKWIFHIFTLFQMHVWVVFPLVHVHVCTSLFFCGVIALGKSIYCEHIGSVRAIFQV